MGWRYCPILAERPHLMRNPDSTMKGKREGIMLRYQINKPLEASEIHSLE